MKRILCWFGFHKHIYFYKDWRTLIVNCGRCPYEKEEPFIGKVVQ